MRTIRRRHTRQKGSFMLEYAIVCWSLIMLLAGSFEMGMSLIRAIQAGEVVRNANVLTVRGVDLSQSSNQKLLMKTAASLNMANSDWTPNSSGSGVVYISRVYLVGPIECSNGIANWNQQPATCPNYGQYVTTMRIVMGNTGIHASTLGAPTSTKDSHGNITDYEICSTSTDVATGFPGLITLNPDQYTYVAEIFVNTTGFNVFTFLTTPTIFMRNLS